MARAIVRYSLDGDYGNPTGNQIRMNLEEAGWTKIGTASFEGPDLPAAELLDALDEMLRLLRNPLGGGRLDHLWIYVDEPTPSAPMPRPERG